MRYYPALLIFSLTLGTVFEISLLEKIYKFTFSEIVLMLGAFFIIMRMSLRRKLIVYRNDVIMLLWFLLITWAVCAYFWVKDPFQHFAGMVAFCEGLLAYFIILNTSSSGSSPKFRTIVRMFTLSLAIQLFLNIWLGIAQIDNITFYNLKQYAITAMGRSNYIALYFGFSFIYELASQSRAKFFFSLIAGIGMLMTLSRAGMFAIVCGIILLFIFGMRGHKFSNFFKIIALASLLVIISLSTPFGPIFFDSIYNLPSASSVITRGALWQAVWKSFTTAPLLGHGLRWEGDPHNVILRSLSDLGLVGTILFLGVLLSPFIKLSYLKSSLSYMSQNAEAVAISLSHLTMLIHSLVEPAFFGTTSQIWLGTILAYMTILTQPSALSYDRKFRNETEVE